MYDILYTTEYRVSPFVSEKLVANSIPHALEMIEKQKLFRDDPETHHGPDRIAQIIKRKMGNQESELKKIKVEK
jgi:hypothetical protein